MLKIATRKSPLALWQANTVKALLENLGLSVELLPIVTSGDKLQKGALADVTLSRESRGENGTDHYANPQLAGLAHLTTGKGLFVKEIQESLVHGDAHVAVHSMKDLPVEATPGLIVAGILPRAGVRDVLILSPQVQAELAKVMGSSPSAVTLENTPFAQLQTGLKNCPTFMKGIVGTTSARRQMFLRRLISQELNLQILRGNVDTRLGKVSRNEFAAIILAEAGLQRLQLLNSTNMLPLPKDLCVPAPAQGVVAIEINASDAKLGKLLAQSSHPESVLAAAIERFVLAALGGDCHMAIAAHFSGSTCAVVCGQHGLERDQRIVLGETHVQAARDLLANCGNHYGIFAAQFPDTHLAKILKSALEAGDFAAVSRFGHDSK